MSVVSSEADIHGSPIKVNASLMTFICMLHKLH